MSNRNTRRNAAATVSQSTQAEADKRNGAENANQTMARVLGTVPTGALPVPTDAELDAGINTVGTTVEDAAAVLAAERTANGTAILDSDVNNRGRGNAHKSNFQAADDQSKKGPYADEATARRPENVYRNQGKVAWELYEVQLPDYLTAEFYADWVGQNGRCFTWACNADLAIAYVARKANWEAAKAGAKTLAPSVKAKLNEVTAELDKAKAERDALLAKLKAAGIEL